MRNLALIALLFLSSGCNKLEKVLGHSGSPSLSITGGDEVITIIGAGQSNAAQSVHAPATPVYSVTGMVQILFEKEGICPKFTTPTKEAPFYHSAAWVRLGDMIAAQTGKPVRIIVLGYGNTSTRRWLIHLAELEDAVRRYKPSKILWVQGESDKFEGITPGEAYSNMTKIIQASRKYGNPEWYVNLNGLCPDPFRRNDMAVRMAQYQLMTEGTVKRGPDIDHMRYVSPHMFEDSAAHFRGDEGHDAHARAWFNTVLNWN